MSNLGDNPTTHEMHATDEQNWQSGDVHRMLTTLGVRPSKLLSAMCAAPYTKLADKVLWSFVFTGNDTLATPAIVTAITRALRKHTKEQQ